MEKKIYNNDLFNKEINNKKEIMFKELEKGNQIIIRKSTNGYKIQIISLIK